MTTLWSNVVVYVEIYSRYFRYETTLLCYIYVVVKSRHELICLKSNTNCDPKNIEIKKFCVKCFTIKFLRKHRNAIWWVRIYSKCIITLGFVVWPNKCSLHLKQIIFVYFLGNIESSMYVRFLYHQGAGCLSQLCNNRVAK